MSEGELLQIEKAKKLDIDEKIYIDIISKKKFLHDFSKKKIKFPVYFSAGQEYVACSVASYFNQTSLKPMLFGQHRGHSIYIGFGGNLTKLALEFFGNNE